jgi:adenylate cyclase
MSKSSTAENTVEVERKFLVQAHLADLDKLEKVKIRQGYLAITEAGTEVRVRKEGKTCYLTVKMGAGLSRDEDEQEIPPATFARLWPLTKGTRVRKVRYKVYHEGQLIEVDVFRGKLKGLVVAEIEFPDETAAKAFSIPSWLGEEITENEDYHNQNLARYGAPQLEQP